MPTPPYYFETEKLGSTEKTAIDLLIWTGDERHAAVAEALGVTSTDLARLRSERLTAIDADLQAKIATHFDVPAVDLFRSIDASALKWVLTGFHRGREAS